jgi:hypothetical protein
VKHRLRHIYETNNLNVDSGVTEEEIIHDYSKEYNYSEDDFRKKIFPRLKDMRKNDGSIKEYEGYINGRIRVAWQWAGY